MQTSIFTDSFLVEYNRPTKRALRGKELRQAVELALSSLTQSEQLWVKEAFGFSGPCKELDVFNQDPRTIQILRKLRDYQPYE